MFSLRATHGATFTREAFTMVSRSRWSGLFQVAAVVGLAASAWGATPTFTSVKGTVGADGKLTIKGSGFGLGPTVVLFDDFRSGTVGNAHSATAVVGKWSDAKGIVFADPKLSNGKGMRVVDTPGALISKVVFPKASSEVYTSFASYVPDGYKFPSAVGQDQYPTISALKSAWLLDGADAYYTAKSDYVLGGYGGAGFSRIASNDKGGPSTFDTTRDVGWRWDSPVRWAYWMKGNGTERIGSDGSFQATNGLKQVNTSYKDYKAWFRDADPNGAWEAHPNHTWDRINFAGYVRSATSFAEGYNYVLDDVYVAVGENANARVEIGNASTYLACTKLTLVTTGGAGDSWADDSITATIRIGQFTETELGKAYLYVTNTDGFTNLQGFALTSVPEPTSITILMLGGTLIVSRRRTRRRS